jgi:hypothetical protein
MNFMNRWLVGAVFGLAFGVGPDDPGRELVAPSRTAPVWFTDYEAARETARRSGKPLFVVFR